LKLGNEYDSGLQEPLVSRDRTQVSCEPSMRLLALRQAADGKVSAAPARMIMTELSDG